MSYEIIIGLRMNGINRWELYYKRLFVPWSSRRSKMFLGQSKARTHVLELSFTYMSTCSPSKRMIYEVDLIFEKNFKFHYFDCSGLT